MSASPPVLPAMDSENHTTEKQLETPASEADTGLEKNENGAGIATQGEIAEEDQINLEEYPKGVQFVFILLALILSIFMVALDLVCLAWLFQQTNADPANRLSSQRRSQRSRMNFIAFLRSDGTVPPSS